MNNEIPTADNFIYTRNPSPLSDMARRTVEILLIEFAQLHVKEALKQASEKAELDLTDNYKSVEISKKSIIDAYIEENIK